MQWQGKAFKGSAMEKQGSEEQGIATEWRSIDSRWKSREGNCVAMDMNSMEKVRIGTAEICTVKDRQRNAKNSTDRKERILK